MKRRWEYLPLVISIVLFTSLCLISCTTDYVTGKRTFSLVSESQEISLGKEADPQIVAQYGLYDDPELSSMINTMGQKLARVSQRSQLTYTFRVLDSPVVNAFALPGGYVYVTRGILAHFNSEDELAGVLGHEIGHVVARHGAEQMSRVQLASLGLGIGSIVSEEFQKISGIAEAGMGLLFLKFSRGQESESDMLGVEYSTKLGYDSHRMAGFFKTLKNMSEESGQSLPSFLSTHPDPGDREQNVHNLTNEWQGKVQYDPLNKSRYDYLKLIDGIVYGENPRHGYVEDDMFYHPDMKFQFPIPSDWNVMNTPSTVQIISEEKNGAVQLTLGKSASLATEADEFVSSSSISVQRKADTTVNGFPATVIESSMEGEQPLRILSYFISKDQKIFIFHGYTSPELYPTYSIAFRSVMTGFKQVSDQSVLNKQPERLEIRQAPKTATLGSVLATLGVSQPRRTEMALINGMTLNDTVQKGYWIKIVKE